MSDYAIWIVTVSEPKFGERRQYLVEGELHAVEERAIELADDETGGLANWESFGAERVTDATRVVGEIHYA